MKMQKPSKRKSSRIRTFFEDWSQHIFDIISHLLVKHQVMLETNHAEIGEQLMIKLVHKEIESFMKCSPSGSVYVFIKDSRQRIRISNHGKHRGWFRYNIRTDLKKSREERISGQRVFIFSANDLDRMIFRISKDFENERMRNATFLVKQRKSKRSR